MKYSLNGYKQTQKHEGVRLTAYQDGGGVWTIGYGHTHGVQKGDVITLEHAQLFLGSDIEDSVEAVNKYVKVPLTQNQFDALVDFTFNLGTNALVTSTLLRLLNAGKYKEAQLQFIRWNKDNGKVVAGLTARRMDNAALFGTA